MFLALMMTALLQGGPQDGPIATAPVEAPWNRAVLQARLAALAEQIADRPPTPITETVTGPVAEDRPVPERAFDDRAWWERTQCGSEPSEDCLREARNRLANARVDQLAARGGGQAPGAPTPARENCRMVMQRSESGFGGSFTRVCGDGASAERAMEANRAMMEDLRGRTTPEEQPCDRPAMAESQEGWIARCRAMPRF